MILFKSLPFNTKVTNIWKESERIWWPKKNPAPHNNKYNQRYTTFAKPFFLVRGHNRERLTIKNPWQPMEAYRPKYKVMRDNKATVTKPREMMFAELFLLDLVGGGSNENRGTSRGTRGEISGSHQWGCLGSIHCAGRSHRRTIRGGWNDTVSCYFARLSRICFINFVAGWRSGAFPTFGCPCAIPTSRNRYTTPSSPCDIFQRATRSLKVEVPSHHSAWNSKRNKAWFRAAKDNLWSLGNSGL